METELNLKTCTKCKKTYPATLEYFFKYHRNKSTGLESICKSCHREWHANYQREYVANQKYEAFLAYAKNEIIECECCKENEYIKLVLDHIEGGGKKHRKLFGNNKGMYADIKKNGYTLPMRILCHNCNQALSYYGYCPHKPETKKNSNELYKKTTRKRKFTEGLDETVKQCCNECLKEFPANYNYFYKKSNTRNGIATKCIDCQEKISLAANIRKRRKLRKEVLNAYSNNNPKCAKCGIAYEEFLAIDHIFGGGIQDIKNNGNLYYRLKREGWPEGYQVLCHSCNTAKSIRTLSKLYE